MRNILAAAGVTVLGAFLIVASLASALQETQDQLIRAKMEGSRLRSKVVTLEASVDSLEDLIRDSKEEPVKVAKEEPVKEVKEEPVFPKVKLVKPEFEFIRNASHWQRVRLENDYILALITMEKCGPCERFKAMVQIAAATRKLGNVRLVEINYKDWPGITVVPKLAIVVNGVAVEIKQPPREVGDWNKYVNELLERMP